MRRHLHPELFHLFEKCGQNAELAMESSAGRAVPHLQDTWIQVRDALLLEPTFANFIQPAFEDVSKRHNKLSTTSSSNHK